MSDHSHDHGHAHFGPLESITHVHGGAMVLDVGGTVGALHVVLDEEWAGRELFLAAGAPAPSTHTGVWLRDVDRVDGRHVATALFAALEAGAYEILGADGTTVATVEVTGGELTDVDLSAAARVAPAR